MACPVCQSTEPVASQSPAITSTSHRLGIPLQRLPWASALSIDYNHAYDKLASFYAGNPAQPNDWREAIARAQAHPRQRTPLTAVLEAQQLARRAPEASRYACARLGDPRAVAIVTGQQAGLFGGPIYTLLKAITALKLAARIERDFRVPVVPIFWIDAEDHDWDEISGVGLLDNDLAHHTVRLSKPAGANEKPVARVSLDDSIATALEELRRLLPPTEFTDDLIYELGRSYAPGVGMTIAFGRWIETLLGPYGLVVFDSADTTAKPLVRDLFIRELETAGGTAALATDAGAALEARGYHAQVTPSADSVCLFRLDGVREPIKRAGDGTTDFLIGETRVSAATLIKDADDHPERFSPNVLLRPLVQDSLFPTIAYVGGPSELAYLGQLRGIYDHFGIPMPLVCQRASATVLDSGASRFLSRYDFPFEQLQRQDELSLNRLLESQLPPGVESAFTEAERAINDRLNALTTVVPSVDPTLEGAVKSVVGKMTHDLEALHGKIIQAAKRKDDTLRRQFVRTRAQAFPEGEPQERTIGFINLLNRYGPALIEILEQELPEDPMEMSQHWVLTP
jgi:bacillithiol biosynthesis cysteine-adding enzyme BshC